MSLSVQVAGKTDLGCVRTNNEDNFGYDTRYGVFIVCDGMGGQAAGEVASKMGVDIILEYFRKAGGETGKYPVEGKVVEGVSERANALASSIRLANRSIFEAASKNAGHAGMGSTVVAALVKGSFLSIAHVGDSRIYLIRKDSIQQLTNDHSLVMEQVRRGLITQEEAERSNMQNIIIRALGSEETVEPDVDDMVAQPGDILLLASDGLTKHVKDNALLKLVKGASTLSQACDALIQAARDDGGDDNITCVLVRVVEQPWYRRWSGKGSPQWQNSI
ncbi:MAG TPA: Stp1/IreP family PP2C-type Ser/Thr phosphatase [Terriglobales bacterium]|nr:Stp1/IreP family PP2C-type Ser/Thr phosphatase [Terriglobales bacterium]